jgi:hypothetical protein
MGDGGCLEGCFATGVIAGIITAAIVGLLLVFVF